MLACPPRWALHCLGERHRSTDASCIPFPGKNALHFILRAVALDEALTLAIGEESESEEESEEEEAKPVFRKPSAPAAAAAAEESSEYETESEEESEEEAKPAFRPMFVSK